MKYRYQGKTKDGETQVGFVEAANRDAAISILLTHNLFVLSLESADVVRWYDRITRFFGAVRSKDLMIFSRQLATLLEARLPLSNTLKLLYDQTTHPVLKHAVQQISEDVSFGLSFSQALERHDDIFPPFFISMVRSAEVIGNLEQVTGFLADYIEKEYVLASKARSALIYPGIIVGMFLIVGFIMVTVVFPQIGPVFEQAGVILPIYTRVLIGTGAFLGKWWPAVLMAVVFSIIIAFNYLQTSEGRALWDDLKVRMPLVKKVYLPLTITRLSNVIAMLLTGGVPVTQAMEIAGQTINNVLYRDLLNDISNEVRQGETLSNAISRHPDYFPSLVPQMLVVGEATGQVNTMFSRLGTFYGRQADSVIANLVDLIQPVLMVIVGLLVGLLFTSILLPLYKLTSSIG